MKNGNKTLAELEFIKPEIPAPGTTSYLVETVARLMNKKLAAFTVEDLRLMIGQQTGLNYLLPLALDILEKDPFVEGDFYEGDLLLTVLRIDTPFWKENPVLKKRMVEIIVNAKKELDRVDLSAGIRKEIWERMNEFAV